MKRLRALSVALLLAFIMTSIYAQDNSGQNPPTQQGMDQKRPMARKNPQLRERMKARAQEMKEKHQKMMNEMEFRNFGDNLLFSSHCLHNCLSRLR